jgi:hypothetical protein
MTSSAPHLLEVVGSGEDQSYRVVCPGNGKDCESWAECGKDHPCDCGPHPHGSDCPLICDENHSLECDEWLWRDGMLHGEFHQHVGSMVCVEMAGCWMPDWTIEFDQIDHDFAPGLYEFDYEEPDPDDGGVLYILAMRSAGGDAQ